ncbi:PadR family transcriptional regulator [candidate division KSB1 bacterium]|nr:PadR family transcriptional regulator [candidate division KSB1 bacterium]
MYYRELIKGTLATIILKLLSEKDRMYGYQITREVEQITAGEIILKEGSLYPTLHRLEAEGLVSTEIEYIGRRVRKYYSLTAKGTESIKTRLKDFSRFLVNMDKILKLNPSMKWES